MGKMTAAEDDDVDCIISNETSRTRCPRAPQSHAILRKTKLKIKEVAWGSGPTRVTSMMFATGRRFGERPPQSKCLAQVAHLWPQRRTRC